MKKILLIDFYNLFIRCYTKVTKINNEGINLGAVSCTLMSLYGFIKKYNPDCVYLCYEGKNSGYRRRRSFHNYKDGRKSPHTIREDKEFNSNNAFGESLNIIQDLISCLPFNNISCDFLEADDIIAFLNSKLPKEDLKIIISTDKDYYQLIDDNTIVYSPTKKIEITKESFIKEYEITPKNWLIIKSFVGDDSDNIKKINARLGLKTILKKFPSIKINEYTTSLDFLNSIVVDKSNEKILTNENIDIFKKNYDIMNLFELSTISSINYTSIKNQALNEVDVDLTNFKIFLFKDEIDFNASESEFSFLFKKLNIESNKYKKYIREIWQGVPVPIS